MTLSKWDKVRKSERKTAKICEECGDEYQGDGCVCTLTDEELFIGTPDLRLTFYRRVVRQLEEALEHNRVLSAVQIKMLQTHITKKPSACPLCGKMWHTQDRALDCRRVHCGRPPGTQPGAISLVRDQ